MLTVPAAKSVSSTAGNGQGKTTPVAATGRGAKNVAQPVLPRSVAARASAVAPVPVVNTLLEELDTGKGQPTISEAALLACFRGEIEPVSTTGAYHLGLLLATIVMIILPLVYVGIVCLLGYGMYLHAIHDTWLVTSVRDGRAMVMAAILYAGTLLAGGIAILFMFKPFFARPAVVDRRRSLTRKGEPVLFAFVDRICDVVGAPRPQRIDVNCQVNASASFRRGIWSMIVGDDLVLTVGLPLAAGMNIQQFGGVLAHEFGHFTQGAGMRLTYIVRSISFWFTRVVYERDEWDARLVQWCRSLDIRVGFIFWLARLMVWLTRRVLWALMMVGHAVAGYLLRQMEFDADQCETRFAGSRVFEQSQRLLPVLAVSSEAGMSALAEYRREGRLGDNLPRLVAANAQTMPAEVRRKIDEKVDQTETGLFDTHPCDKDRITAARRENAAGVFHAEQPAAALFCSFDELCRNVTWDFYRTLFGPNLKPGDMHPIDDLLARQNVDIEGKKAVARFFQGTFSGLRIPLLPMELPEEETIDAKATAVRLNQARQELLSRKDAARKATKRYREYDTQLCEAGQARAMFEAHLRTKPTTFSVPLTNVEQARSVTTAAQQGQEELGGQLAEFEAAVGRRIEAALCLLKVPQVAKRLSDTRDRLVQAERFLPVVYLCRGLNEALVDLRNTRVELLLLLNQLANNRQSEDVTSTIRDRMNTAAKQVRALSERLSVHRYPLEHGRGDITIAEYAVEGVPASDDLEAIVNSSGQLLDNVAAMVMRMFGRLAQTVEAVETAIGLPPLPEPSAEG